MAAKQKLSVVIQTFQKKNIYLTLKMPCTLIYKIEKRYSVIFTNREDQWNTNLNATKNAKFLHYVFVYLKRKTNSSKTDILKLLRKTFLKFALCAKEFFVQIIFLPFESFIFFNDSEDVFIIKVPFFSIVNYDTKKST